MAYYISKLNSVDGKVEQVAQVVKRLSDVNGFHHDGEVVAVFKSRRDFTERWNYKTYEVKSEKLVPVERFEIPKQIGSLLFNNL